MDSCDGKCMNQVGLVSERVIEWVLSSDSGYLENFMLVKWLKLCNNHGINPRMETKMTHEPVTLCRFKNNKVGKTFAYYEIKPSLIHPIPAWLYPFVRQTQDNEILVETALGVTCVATVDSVILQDHASGVKVIKRSTFDFLYEKIDGTESLDSDSTRSNNTQTISGTDMTLGDLPGSLAREKYVMNPAMINTAALDYPTSDSFTDVTNEELVKGISFPPAIDKGVTFPIESQVGPVRTSGGGKNQQSIPKGSPDVGGDVGFRRSLALDSTTEPVNTVGRDAYIALTREEYDKRIEEVRSSAFNRGWIHGVGYAKEQIVKTLTAVTDRQLKVQRNEIRPFATKKHTTDESTVGDAGGPSEQQL